MSLRNGHKLYNGYMSEMYQVKTLGYEGYKRAIMRMVKEFAKQEGTVRIKALWLLVRAGYDYLGKA